MTTAPATPGPELSVVTMLYRSEPYVAEFYRRVRAAAEAVTPSYELIFVDDGSPDAAGSIVKGLLAADPRVTLVELSRNFGHHPAALAGLRQARGRRVFIIDVDLEEDPAWLLEFARELDATGADVVYGVNQARGGAAFRKHTGTSFWRLFNALSDVPVPHNPCTVRMMRRRYVDALLSLGERNVFLAGQYAWLGFRQVARPVRKGVRPTRSSYTVARLASLFLDAVTSFSSYPLRLIFLSGALISSLALLGGTALAVRKALAPETVSLGWSSIIVSIWFLGGLIIAFLGIIGIYLSKIFNETKQRPLYVVREVHRGGAPETGA
jgi:putative glycosyltransferase